MRRRPFFHTFVLKVIFVLITPQLSCGGLLFTNSVTENQMTTPAEQFSISSLNHTVPEAVLEEVSLFVGGGGEIGCGDRWDDNFEPTENYSDYVCLKIDEKSKIIWNLPDGSNIVNAAIPEPKDDNVMVLGQPDCQSDLIYLTYHFPMNTPLGEYHVIVEGQEDRWEDSFYMDIPSQPRFYYDDYNGELIFWLVNFQPNERIRLYTYKQNPDDYGKGNLLGWQEYRINGNGNLTIKLTDKDARVFYDGYYYVIVGDSTGEVREHNLGCLIADESILR